MLAKYVDNNYAVKNGLRDGHLKNNVVSPTGFGNASFLIIGREFVGN